jgi:AcrR family transcriptional regulator
VQRKSLTPETTDTILEAAWRRILEEGRVDVPLSEIARAAGVTRQSVYLAFGNRAGLLVAMARRADSRSTHSRRMAEIAVGPGNDVRTFLAFTEAWLDHLPEIFPIGRLLGAAAATDADAAQVFADRMVAGLHGKFAKIAARLAAADQLPPGLSPEKAADLAWSFTHLDTWRQLVVERGWSPRAYRENRIALVYRLLTTPSGSRA